MQPAPSHYRPDIDGLRAVSILSVVGYHVGLAWIPGGFIGVDVFFVISGYLIIGQMIDRHRTGKFRFGDFWARRALRILPPYAAVLVVSCLIAYFVLVLPTTVEAFGHEVLFSSLMLANHYFLNNLDYFDVAADLRPLLHMWSLAVEEQFYLVAPLVLAAVYWMLRRLSPRWRLLFGFGVGATIFSVSLAACIWWTTERSNDLSYAFFLTALRAWEFLAGAAAIVVAALISRLPRIALNVIAGAGLAMIAYSAGTLSDESLYPSYNALPPVLGAMLVIAAGTVTQHTVTGRLLSSTPFVAVGLVSYAWYLWHWPLLSFARIHNFGERNLSTDLAMVTLSFGLSIATYFLIEKPIKRWRTGRRLGWPDVGRGASTVVPVLALAAIYILVAPEVFRSRLPEGVIPYVDLGRPRDAAECHMNTVIEPEACIATAAGRPIGLLIGDSHARVSYVGLRDLLEPEAEVKIALISRPGCFPAFGVDRYLLDGRRAPRNCSIHFGRGIRAVRKGEMSPSFAILDARWAAYSPTVRPLGLRKAGHAAPNQAEFYRDTIRSTVKQLHDWGAKRVLIVGPVPEFRRLPVECLAHARRFGKDLDRTCSSPRKEVDESRAWSVDLIREALTAFTADQVRFIDPVEALCDANWCRPYRGTQTLYRDKDHLVEAGVEVVYRAFEAEYRWVAAAPSSNFEAPSPPSTNPAARATTSSQTTTEPTALPSPGAVSTDDESGRLADAREAFRQARDQRESRLVRLTQAEAAGDTALAQALRLELEQTAQQFRRLRTAYREARREAED